MSKTPTAPRPSPATCPSAATRPSWAIHPALKPESVAILLVNSGTPDSLATGDVRRFLANLLGDPRVVELPRWVWLPILHGIILRTRPSRSAIKYQKIWTEEGSPLTVHTNSLISRLQAAMAQRYTSPVKVAAAMLYSKPSIQAAIQCLLADGARRLLVVPLFPQASGVSTGAVFDQVADKLRQQRWLPDLKYLHGYHDHPAYISALRQSILTQWNVHGRTQHLLFAFHGIPRKYFEQGDPYHCFCHKTSRMVAESLNLSSECWTVSFQSRFGPGQWLQPYTEDVLNTLPQRGVREVTVISPGFAVDCLETLEELAIEGRNQFLAMGGERFIYVPALNSSTAHVEMLTEILENQLGNWVDTADPISEETNGLAKRRWVATA